MHSGRVDSSTTHKYVKAQVNTGIARVLCRLVIAVRAGNLRRRLQIIDLLLFDEIMHSNECLVIAIASRLGSRIQTCARSLRSRRCALSISPAFLAGWISASNVLTTGKHT